METSLTQAIGGIEEKLAKIIGKPPEFISETSAVVAIHSGPGCVAVCLTEVRSQT
jgi:fatty acid-binding protein DegV